MTYARPMPADALHGLSTYTNYGCRCEVCTDASRENGRRYRARKKSTDNGVLSQLRPPGGWWRDPEDTP